MPRTAQVDSIEEHINKFVHFVSFNLEDLLSKNIDVSLFERHSHSA